MIQAKKDQLLLAERNLAQALAQDWQSRERSWLDDVRQALSQVEGAMFSHSTPSEGQLLRPREPAQKEPTPGLAREVETLRDEHTGISQQINALLASFQIASPGQQDFDGYRQAGEKLLEDLRDFRQTENKLVIENALRDTGGET